MILLILQLIFLESIMKYDKSLLFIDGGFLSKLSKHLGNGIYLKFKIKDFINNLANRYHFNFKTIFYYTAPPYQSNKPDKLQVKRKENYDSFKSSLIKEGFIWLRSIVKRVSTPFCLYKKFPSIFSLCTLPSLNIKPSLIKELLKES